MRSIQEVALHHFCWPCTIDKFPLREAKPQFREFRRIFNTQKLDSTQRQQRRNRVVGRAKQIGLIEISEIITKDGKTRQDFFFSWGFNCLKSFNTWTKVSLQQMRPGSPWLDEAKPTWRDGVVYSNILKQTICVQETTSLKSIVKSSHYSNACTHTNLVSGSTKWIRDTLALYNHKCRKIGLFNKLWLSALGKKTRHFNSGQVCYKTPRFRWIPSGCQAIHPVWSYKRVGCFGMIWDDVFQHENKRFDVDGCGAAPANPTQEAERNWAVLTPYVEAELVASNDSSHKWSMMKPDSHVQSSQIEDHKTLLKKNLNRFLAWK